ncbi:Trp biosynthesis-associated membrane protein [Actinomadura hibisca]|uniref:Trp biosynthesis-associated membrane protein n=1 Tax=Actinomadura hibisca TaxID=68565 RepID=UPI000834A7E7|nr:Trp biosynthesis-associated membrane protein [Actinomadura hibisca]
MTPARERGLAALACAAGAGLTLLAAGRPWATVRARDAITPFGLELTGRDLGALPGGLGWAALAGLAVLFATRGRVRAGLGALLAVFGVVIAVSSATAVRAGDVRAAAGGKSTLLRLAEQTTVQVGPWWAVSLAGGVLVAAAGLVTLLRGARWPGMSARYERQGAAPAGPARARTADRDAAGLWKSLDRGEDPTEDTADEPADTTDTAAGPVAKPTGRTADEPAGSPAAGESRPS